MSDEPNNESEKKRSIIRKPILYPWCSAHRGFPPIFDISLYECPKCGSAVCGACLFVTEDGVMCKNCAKNAVDNLRPIYDEKIVSEKRRTYAEILLIVFAIFYFGGVAFIMINVLFEEEKMFLLVEGSIIILGYALMLGAYFVLFRREITKNEVELSEEELRKLDEGIAGSVKSNK